MNLLKLMHKTGVDRMQVSLINGEPHPAIVALADELEAHWKKTVTERDEYAQELRDQVEKLAEECVVLRASSRSKLETISSLELQVEKLTEERDDLLIACDLHNKNGDMAEQQLAAKDADNKWLRSAVTLQAEQLAALAEQNEKLRKVLLRLACLGNGDQYGNSIGNCIAQEALSLPDLASPVLNRIRAEAMRMAAQFIEDKYDFLGEEITVADEIRAKADELEKGK